MFDTIAGLPIHPLVVHAVEVIVPLAAVVVLLAALWPRFRRWAYLLPAILGLAALVLVPVATQSGEALEERVDETAAVEAHTHMGEDLTPWVIGLAVVALALTWWSWRERSTLRDSAQGTPDHPARGRPRAAGVPAWLPVVLVVGALVTAGGTVYQSVRIGHSGATAVWGEAGQDSPSGDEGGEGEDDD